MKKEHEQMLKKFKKLLESKGVFNKDSDEETLEDYWTPELDSELTQFVNQWEKTGEEAIEDDYEQYLFDIDHKVITSILLEQSIPPEQHEDVSELWSEADSDERVILTQPLQVAA